MEDLGGEKSGLPFYAFIDAKGKMIANSNAMPNNQNIGYPAEKEEIAAFEGLLKKSAKHMTDDQRSQVMSYFVKNAPKPRAPSPILNNKDAIINDLNNLPPSLISTESGRRKWVAAPEVTPASRFPRR